MATEAPLGQQYHEAVEALKSEGMTNADAIRQVAADFEKTENAVRGSIHQYKRRDGNTSTTGARRRRRSSPSVDDLLVGARQSLEQALELVDREVDEAKVALENAQDRYDAVVSGVADKKAEIQKKLEALS